MTLADWQAAREQIDGGIQFRLRLGESAMDTRALLELLAADANFASSFNALLADVEFAAFFWELPPLSYTSAKNVAEFVVLDAPQLINRRADPRAFGEYFAAENGGAVSFSSLGRDATLIAPCPIQGPETYTHLANFVRRAPAQQVRRFWQLVGNTALRNIGDLPIWLSTSGLGVNWLHVRLDQQPKYYQHRPYRQYPPI